MSVAIPISSLELSCQHTETRSPHPPEYMLSQDAKTGANGMRLLNPSPQHNAAHLDQDVTPVHECELYSLLQLTSINLFQPDTVQLQQLLGTSSLTLLVTWNSAALNR